MLRVNYCYLSVKGGDGTGKLKTSEGRKFLLALLVVFTIAAACVGRATIVGVIEQYNIPLSARTTSMFVLQSAMIFVYSTVFTVLLAIPLGIFFLGGRENTKHCACGDRQ
ncbi:DUF2534 family protein [Enterobacter hormaechei]|uniref:DUF2534 family protein n=1 Tax=Enterobacter hormaechei TaxID=158836 RepID=A0A4Y5ZPL4_9ENTR|nr:DUF2534 family protein [Enterobacter hormaechei]